MAATQMTLQAMKSFVYKYHTEGLTNGEIAKRLKDAGYVSERTHSPIDEFGVGYHVRGFKSKKAPKLQLASPAKEAGPTHPSHVPHAKPSRIQMALDILQSDLDGGLAKELAAKILSA